MKADNIQIDNAATNEATEENRKEVQPFLTVHEVSKLLQVPVSWVYGRLRDRSTEPLPGYRVGKYWRFREQEIIAWVKRHRRDSHAA